MKNKKPLNLKTRIIITLCTFSLMLTLTFSGLIEMVSSFARDSIFDVEVKKITELVYSDYIENRFDPDSVPYKFTVSIGLDGISEKIIRDLDLETLPEGIYESQAPIDCHFSITRLPGQNKRLYVLYDVTELERLSFDESFQKITIFLSAVLTTILGIVIGILLAKRIISPVSRLAEKVRETDPESPIENLSEGFSEDEVGELARTLESYITRLSKFVTREREFTRNVSHELRTPLAVIKNGAELLRSSTPNPKAHTLTALDRIDRAVLEMEELITTFLLLARENDLSSHFTPCNIYRHLERLAEKYSYLLDGKNISCRIAGDHDLIVRIPEPLLKVILGNLIRNAFQYASDGIVEITMKKNSVTIVNKGTETTKNHENRDSIIHGIGHSITARLCTQLGGDFTFEEEGSTIIAKVVFPEENHS